MDVLDAIIHCNEWFWLICCCIDRLLDNCEFVTRPYALRGAVYMKSVGRDKSQNLYRVSLHGRSNRINIRVFERPPMLLISK